MTVPVASSALPDMDVQAVLVTRTLHDSASHKSLAATPTSANGASITTPQTTLTSIARNAIPQALEFFDFPPGIQLFIVEELVCTVPWKVSLSRFYAQNETAQSFR